MSRNFKARAQPSPHENLIESIEPGIKVISLNQSDTKLYRPDTARCKSK